MTNTLNAALEYAQNGYSIFPCRPRSKTPLVKAWQDNASNDEVQIRQWWEKWPEANIGLPTGPINNLFVLDTDSPEAFKEAGERGYIPTTKTYDSEGLKGQVTDACIVQTGRGYQVYFTWTDGIRNSTGDLGENLDVRGDGGFVVGVGSIHESGSVYEYASSRRKATAAPECLLKALREGARQFGSVDFGKPIPQGQRNAELTRIAGKLTSIGLDAASTRATLHIINRNQCDPPLEAHEVDGITLYENQQVSSSPKRNDSDDTRTTGVTMSDVESEEVTWLWDRRIPYGKLTLLEGDPDFGKSLITVDLAARVSRGKVLTDGSLEDVEYLEHLDSLDNVGGVVILNAEDAPGDTIKPRLLAAGADLTRIRAVHAIKPDDTLFSIPEDLSILEREIEQVDAKLVIVDPLSAFMKGDPNKDSDVRKALTPFSKLAERTGIAVVVVRHFNKNVDTKALYRGGGSIGIIGAARSAWAVAPHPHDDDVSVLVSQKGNLSKKADTIAYTIVEAGNGAPRIQWGGVVHFRADEILNPQKATKVDEAQDWLRKTLQDGPVPANEMEAKRKAAGISLATLNRAKKGVASSERNGEGWDWWLIEDYQGAQGYQESQGAQHSHL